MGSINSWLKFGHFFILGDGFFKKFITVTPKLVCGDEIIF